MPLTIMTTQAIKDRNVSTFEEKLNQSTPQNDQSFLKVLAVIEALMQTSLQKYAAERSRQNLALTATGIDLETIGAKYEVYKKPAEATVLTAILPAVTGTVIPMTISFIGENNGIRYLLGAAVTAVAGEATLSLTADTPGVAGNLLENDSLFISSPISGAESIATVSSIDNTGTEIEDEEVYRARVLFAERSAPGGGNSTNYKQWAEEISGVKRAYPYSGKPFESPDVSYPGDRTLYIEANIDVNSDGIAPTPLLDEVRVALNTDPDTLKSRPPLGLIDSTLYIESIRRTLFYVTITNMEIATDLETQVRATIDTDLENYFLNLVPYIDGLDLLQERNDLITPPSISEIVHDILKANGGAAELVSFSLESGGLSLPRYRLNPGELAGLGGIVYA